MITKEEGGKTLEPMEKVFLDIPEDKVGTITEKLSTRKGRMTNLQNHGSGRVNMEFSIPSRGFNWVSFSVHDGHSGCWNNE